MRELNEGVIKFSLGHYNFNVLVENNEVIDFIIEKSKIISVKSISAGIIRRKMK